MADDNALAQQLDAALNKLDLPARLDRHENRLMEQMSEIVQPINDQQLEIQTSLHKTSQTVGSAWKLGTALRNDLKELHISETQSKDRLLLLETQTFIAPKKENYNSQIPLRLLIKSPCTTQLIRNQKI
ncbi:UNVERIFIED_CONTAM: hypothetical protein K2H54_072621 [Gekko kuhli]